MKQFGIILSVSLIMINTGISGLQFNDCGSKSGKFTKVVVSNCDTTKNECILKRNTTASITIDFSLAEDVSSIKTVVHGKVLGIEMPFHLQNPNACVDSGLKCPLEKGETYEYIAKLPVLKAYPKVSVLVKWELQDQNDEDIICIEIPAKIHKIRTFWYCTGFDSLFHYTFKCCDNFYAISLKKTTRGYAERLNTRWSSNCE